MLSALIRHLLATEIELELPQDVSMIESQSRPLSTRIRQNLVITLPGDLGAETFSIVQNMTLDSIRACPTSFVIFDCSAVRFLDADEFEQLRQAAEMARALGAYPCLVGLRPETVILLVEADVNIAGIRAFSGLNEALNEIDAGEIHGRQFQENSRRS